MSLLHENLAHETSYEKVNMSEYLTQIAQNLQKTTEHLIEVQIERFRLDMTAGINLGLLLNEAVANAIKHAYSKDEIGKIEVKLQRNDTECRLSVKDYGEGFDTSVMYDSLGLVLMEDIISFFKDGTLMFDFRQGTEVIALFYIGEGEVCH